MELSSNVSIDLPATTSSKQVSKQTQLCNKLCLSRNKLCLNLTSLWMIDSKGKCRLSVLGWAFSIFVFAWAVTNMVWSILYFQQEDCWFDATSTNDNIECSLIFMTTYFFSFLPYKILAPFLLWVVLKFTRPDSSYNKMIARCQDSFTEKQHREVHILTLTMYILFTVLGFASAYHTGHAVNKEIGYFIPLPVKYMQWLFMYYVFKGSFSMTQLIFIKNASTMNGEIDSNFAEIFKLTEKLQESINYGLVAEILFNMLLAIVALFDLLYVIRTEENAGGYSPLHTCLLILENLLYLVPTLICPSLITLSLRKSCKILNDLSFKSNGSVGNEKVQARITRILCFAWRQNNNTGPGFAVFGIVISPAQIMGWLTGIIAVFSSIQTVIERKKTNVYCCDTTFEPILNATCKEIAVPNF